MRLLPPAVVVALLACSAPTSARVILPDAAEWVDHGAILTATGIEGDWNREFAGFAPCALLVHDGRYYLYYIGSDGDRTADAGPRHRALGVAHCAVESGCRTAADWVDHPGNPILEHLPSIGQGGEWGEEEGIFTCAVAVDEPWIHLYYGAMTNVGHPESVSDDVMVVSSTDPLSFPDGVGGTVVIDHLDQRVWGWGDELDPLGVWQSFGTWHLFYSVGAGVDPVHQWALGHASGPAFDQMTAFEPVLDDPEAVQGGMDPSVIGPSLLAVVMDKPLVGGGDPRQLVHTLDADRPGSLRLVQAYTFPEVRHQVTLLDEAADQWLMAYRNDVANPPWNTGSVIGLKTAPVRGRSGWNPGQCGTGPAVLLALAGAGMLRRMRRRGATGSPSGREFSGACGSPSSVDTRQGSTRGRP